MTHTHADDHRLPITRPDAPHARRPVEVEGPVTTSRRMKEECWDLHQAAEQGHTARAMITGTLARGSYVDLLGQLYAAMVVLDRLIIDARAHVPAIAALIDDEQMQATNLRKDLRFLGVDPDSIAPRRGAQGLIDTARRLADENPLALLGLHYVREGANNGNRYVAKKLRLVYEMPGDDGFRHLDPYASEQRPRWDRFKATLDAQPLTPAQQDDLVAAGREMYRAITAIHEDVAKASA